MSASRQSPATGPFRINPIFARYCRSRLRPKGLASSLLIAGITAGFVFSITRAISFHRIAEMTVADAERAPLLPLLVVQAVILFVLGTGQVAGGMTAEADEGVIDYQRLAPMSPLSKVVGYLFGLPIREYAMFGITLPFTMWSLWRGQVPASAWVPLYTAVLTSTILYHLTGLVAGTVLKNRRWAFLVSIGMVFLLYSVVPQLAKFGLVFFKYFTINPVVMECVPFMMPEREGSLIAAAQRLLELPRPFGLSFPEVVFTAFSQGGLIVTFVVMLCRRWRRAESHLMGKAWASGFFVWVQVLLLGNALPLIDSGSLFPTRGFMMMYGGPRRLEWSASPVEALVMSAIYGIASLWMLYLLTAFISPSRETQIRGWRRTRKLGASSIPPFSDAAGSFRFVFVMAVAGAAGWYLFTRGIIESRWFPGHSVPSITFVWFLIVMLAAGHSFHAVLEAKGSRFLVMSLIFVGLVPVLVAAVLVATSNRLFPVAAWIAAISAPIHPVYAVLSSLFPSELPVGWERSVPRAWWFWQAVWLLGAVRLALYLRRERGRIAASVDRQPAEATPAAVVPEPASVTSPRA